MQGKKIEKLNLLMVKDMGYHEVFIKNLKTKKSIKVIFNFDDLEMKLGNALEHVGSEFVSYGYDESKKAYIVSARFVNNGTVDMLKMKEFLT